MLSRLTLEATGRAQRPPLLARIAAEFPAVGLAVAPPGASPAELCIDAATWSNPALDLLAFDARVNALSARGPFAVSVSGGSLPQLGRVALEVLLRCQRHAPRRSPASRGPAFDEVLARHRALHDLDKPLVRADYDHALDTWQWALRLRPDAGLAVQIAALFHDVERLVSEADARIEHRAPDYQAFKDAHARAGVAIAERALAGAPLPSGELARALELIAGHERPGGDPDLALLNDADALSFFSLNSGGYMRYFGPEQTRRKIAYTLGRLAPAARPWLADLRHPPAAAPLLAEALRALGAMEGAPVLAGAMEGAPFRGGAVEGAPALGGAVEGALALAGGAW